MSPKSIGIHEFHLGNSRSSVLQRWVQYLNVSEIGVWRIGVFRIPKRTVRPRPHGGGSPSRDGEDGLQEHVSHRASQTHEWPHRDVNRFWWELRLAVVIHWGAGGGRGRLRVELEKCVGDSLYLKVFESSHTSPRPSTTKSSCQHRVLRRKRSTVSSTGQMQYVSWLSSAVFPW